MQDIKVGYTRISFAEKRNFLQLPFTRVRFKRCYDRYTLKRKLMQTRQGTNWYVQNTHKPLFIQDNVDMYHFFNTISYTKKPYITTFETLIPRWQKHIAKGISLLGKENMLQLVAISHNAKAIQTDFLKREYPEYDNVLHKLSVIAPAQKTYVTENDVVRKNQSVQKMHFVIAGHLFFLKGGLEVLQSFDYLLKNDYPVKLSIVSQLQPDSQVTKSNQADLATATSIIHAHNDIQWYKSLSNHEVIHLLKKAQVALLPSYADTYGYFALEAQACGCPVITTNIRALDEINNEHAGWIIKLEKNKLGYAVLNTDAELKNARHAVRQALIATIENLVNSPGDVTNKGLRALQKIKTDHDPVEQANKYYKLYKSACND
ncbi:MAG: glycosyltransferase [Bacteroidales bacterium]